MKPVICSSQGSHILYDASRRDHVADRDFDPVSWSARGGLDTAVAGRGTTFFLTDGAARYVLRHYRRGGLVAKLSEDRYWWAGLERSRPFREFRLLAWLHAQGLPVPPPVAARVVRSGLFYRGDLMTVRLDAQPLSHLLRSAPLTPAVWAAIGGTVRRFHAAGAFHADLNAHNILLSGAGEVFLIDLDRGDRRAPGPWEQANLARLRRSLDKLRATDPQFAFTQENWDALRSGYFALAAE